MPRRRLLAVCALAIVPVFVAACGDDAGDDADAASPSAGNATTTQAVSVSTASPQASGPASKYTVLLEDVGLQWRTDVLKVLDIDKDFYADSGDVFVSRPEGMRLLNEWGYLEGYETKLVPEGPPDDSVLNGSYYITVETHRFEDADGAKKAYKYYADGITSDGAPPVAGKPVGNEHIGFTGIGPKIGKSNVNSQFEQIIFRRGNVVSIVLTTGAQGFMKHEYAWNLAALSDAKILGDKPAVEPTPTSNYKTPTPAPKQ